MATALNGDLVKSIMYYAEIIKNSGNKKDEASPYSATFFTQNPDTFVSPDDDCCEPSSVDTSVESCGM